MARVSLIAPSGNLDAVRIAMQKIRDAGHQITCNWPVYFERSDYTSEELQDIAQANIQGVIDADVVVVFIPYRVPTSVGMGVELGWAFCSEQRILLLEETPEDQMSSYWRNHPYRHWIGEQYTTLAEVLAEIAKLPTPQA